MASLNMTPFSLFFLVFTLGYVIALVYVVLAERRHTREEGRAEDHVFSLLVPARNEGAVIGTCLEGLLALDYPAEKFEILVVDDGSDDQTPVIASRYEAEHPGRVRILRVPDGQARQGKASALNHGYKFLLERSPFRADPGWIIGVFDADGSPDTCMLGKAAYQFRDARVGGVQATVRIRNRDTSWLTRMQDIEFVGFARMTQLIRTRISGSASLAGNGQFVRNSALQEVPLDSSSGRIWDPSALTEDLELTARLAMHNWDIRQLGTSQVWQEGVETMRSLMRQRTRWAWGSLQVFAAYVIGLRILRAHGVRLRKRLDLFFNLSMFLVSPLVLITWIIGALAFAGLFSVGSALPSPVMLLLSFGYFPVVGYGLVTSNGYARRRLLTDLVGFAIYTYHWVPCLYVGLWQLATHRTPVWWKTARSAEHPSG